MARYSYDAFGNTIARGAQAGQPYRFSTKEQHAFSGLYDYGFRFYSPGLGRWINRDPIAETGGLNLYGFVANGPLNKHDDWGQLCVPCAIILIIGGAIILGGVEAMVDHRLPHLRQGQPPYRDQ
ncbi:MAG: RHS repeat-associated core domain-containing protein, partial [Thermoproteota archaeon]|nr:RHS repeat-associated core domain-containing protein [Thermoproteota archaeon]